MKALLPIAAGLLFSAGTQGQNYYPVYPYYSIVWNDTAYNVTWAATQPVIGSVPESPYPYPVVQGGGEVMVHPYPNYDYACSYTNAGQVHRGTCSLGGRGRGDYGGCEKRAATLPSSTTTASIPSPTPVLRRSDSVVDTCTFPVPGFVDGVFQLGGGGNATGTCYTYDSWISFAWDCQALVANYDSSGRFLNMSLQDASCSGSSYRSSPTPVIYEVIFEFPCQLISGNATESPVTRVCAYELDALDADILRSFPSERVVTMGLSTMQMTFPINTTCVAYENFGIYWSNVYCLEPCYYTATQYTPYVQNVGNQIDGTASYGSTCRTDWFYTEDAFNRTIKCDWPVSGLVAGQYNGTKVISTTCYQETSIWGSKNLVQLPCYQWTKGVGYAAITCSATYTPPVKNRIFSYSPCQPDIPALYVNGILTKLTVNLTCATFLTDVWDYVDFTYSTTTYSYPCQSNLTFAADASITGYVDTTCQQFIYGNASWDDTTVERLVGDSETYNPSGVFDGSATGGSQGTAVVSSYWVLPSVTHTLGIYSVQWALQVSLWAFQCIGSPTFHSAVFNGYEVTGTFPINSTHCGGYSSLASPEAENLILYLAVCAPDLAGADGLMFCEIDQPQPGGFTCTSLGCIEIPGQSTKTQCTYGWNAQPCAFTIGYDLCVDNYQYDPSMFSHFNEWSNTSIIQPARSPANGSFWYPGQLTLVASQSLIAPTLTVRSGEFDINHTMSGATWIGPYWPEVDTRDSITPIYTWPFPNTAPVAFGTDGATRPWSTFPFLPSHPIPVAPLNVSLDSQIVGGIYPFPVWPMVPINVARNWSSPVPWITFPFLKYEVQESETCPSPPASGTLYLSTTDWSKQNRQYYYPGTIPTLSVINTVLEATFLMDSFNCSDVPSDPLVFWTFDTAVLTYASLPQQEFRLEGYTVGTHNISAQRVFTNSAGYVISTVKVTASFSIAPPPTLSANWTSTNATVPTWRVITLDASASTNSLFPCTFARYIGPLAASDSCYDPVTNIAAAIVEFACTTRAGAACPLGLASTVTMDELWGFGGLSLSNATFTAMVVETTNSSIKIYTDTPILVIPGLALPGDFIFETAYELPFPDLVSPVSLPLEITVSAQASYCENPPSEGLMTFSGPLVAGATVPTFHFSSETGYATAAVTPFTCADAVATYIFWSYDVVVVEAPQNPLLIQTGETRTDSLSWSTSLANVLPGNHTLNCRIVYLSANHQYISSVVITSEVAVISWTFHPVLATASQKISKGQSLTLDMTASSDDFDPCYFQNYVSSAAYSSCQANNPSSTAFSGFAMIMFSCQTTAGKACTTSWNSGALESSEDFMKYRSNSSYTNLVDFSYEENTLIITDIPFLTIPAANLLGGICTWVASYQYVNSSGFWIDSIPESTAQLQIIVSDYMVLAPLELGTGASTYITGAVVRIIASTTTDSPLSSLSYNWSVVDSSGTSWSSTIVTKTAGTANLRVNTATMTSGTYTVTLLVADTDGHNATASTSFSVTAALVAPTACAISPSSGVELDTTFTVTCPDPGGLLYAYSYFADGIETVVAYPGSTSQDLLLPSSTSGTVNVYVRLYISGNAAAQSDPQILPVTVAASTASASDLASSVSNLITNGNAAQTAAAVDTFVGKLTGLNMSDPATQSMVNGVVNALTSSVNSNEDVGTAGAQTNAIAKLLASGGVGDDGKRDARAAILTLVSVLATPGYTVPKATLESAASGCLASTLANSTDSGDAVLQTFAYLGVALTNSLATGESDQLAVLGVLLEALMLDPLDIPDSMTSSSLSRRDTTSLTPSCDANLAGTLPGIVNASRVGAVVTIQASCLAQSPYFIDPLVLRTDSLLLTPSALSLGVLVDGTSLPSMQLLDENVNVTIPTSYSSLGKVTRRDTTVVSYTTSCLLWNLTTSAWSDTGCTALSTGVNNTVATCSCSYLGTYTVRLTSTIVENKTQGSSGFKLTDPELYGIIAGGGAVVVIAVALTIFFVVRKKKAKKSDHRNA
ncbi:hypothetical protein HKX48_008160 [Thoreauomyces humboldtii]|nr:hypothetical protein HKX48_008160 [Thoreauomyces humboldtii]